MSIIPPEEQAQSPDRLQKVDPFQIETAQKLTEIKAILEAMNSNTRTLTDTLATHIRQNIEAMQRISDYIGEQMSYRLYRQNLEENNLQLQLQQKNLELQFMEKQYRTAEEEKKADDEEQEHFQLEYKKQQLEIENLRKALEMLQSNKNSTKDKLSTVQFGKPHEQKMRETIINTALGTLTAAGVTGTLAFIIWLVRFYIQNTQP